VGGIFGYTGVARASEIVFELLILLEYRGYDSDGIERSAIRSSLPGYGSGT